MPPFMSSTATESLESTFDPHPNSTPASRPPSIGFDDIHDELAHPQFISILRKTCALLDAPIGFLALGCDHSRCIFPAVIGIGTEQVRQTQPICLHIIRETKPFIIDDARVQSRTGLSQLVTDTSPVRCFAGVPLPTHPRPFHGALCIMDDRPHRFDSTQIESLQSMAQWIVDKIDLVRLSRLHRETHNTLCCIKRELMLDPHLKIWNKKSIRDRLVCEWERHRRRAEPVGVIMIDLDHFKQINDSLGHAVGDQVLQISVMQLRRALRPYDSLGRFGGDEFIAIIDHGDLQTSADIAERMRRQVERAPLRTTIGEVPLTLSAGVASTDNAQYLVADQLITDADHALYDSKKLGRNQVSLYPRDD